MRYHDTQRHAHESCTLLGYFGNTVLTPFLEMFEDRLTGILLIDGIGIVLIILFACVNLYVLICGCFC